MTREQFQDIIVKTMRLFDTGYKRAATEFLVDSLAELCSNKQIRLLYDACSDIQNKILRDGIIAVAKDAKVV